MTLLIHFAHKCLENQIKSGDLRLDVIKDTDLLGTKLHATQMLQEVYVSGLISTCMNFLQKNRV